MLTRFALLAAVLALILPGCKKKASDAAGSQVLNPSPTPAVAATADTRADAGEARRRTRTAQVVVYCYHRFVDKVRRPDTEITPQEFEAQMKELKDKNIPVIGMQDFLAWKRGEKSIPPKAGDHHAR